MKFLCLFVFVWTQVYAGLAVHGHTDIDTQIYLTKAPSRESSSFTAKQTLELEYTQESWRLYGDFFAQLAYNDFLGTSQQTQRSFARIDELYGEYESEESLLHVGKSIRFWGALELRNIVDVFNPNELRNDIFSTDKLGVYNASYSYFTQDAEVQLIVKVHEQDIKMADFPYVYYPFAPSASYEKNLQSATSQNRPSVYLAYTASLESEYALDYAFIYTYGYDAQRYYSQLASQSNTYVQNTYLAHKFMSYNTLVVGATLLKLELVYADVESGMVVGDYAHLGLGFEHTFEDFASGSALGLIGEYYSYETFESNKLDDLALFETMQNDLFIGARYVFNDADDSSFVGGLIHDLEYDEQSYYLEFETRFGDNVKVEVDYNYIEPSKKAQTAYALLGRHQRLGLNVAYHF